MSIFKDILTYAFRGSGKYVLIVCVIMSLVAKLAGIAPLVGPIAALLLTAYFCAIFYQLIQSSAIGDNQAPQFPEVSNLLEDIIWPMIQIIVVSLISFGPLIGYLIFGDENRFSLLNLYALVGFGVIYFPMAILAVVVLGYTGAASPHIVIPAVFRGGWLYWVGVLLLILLYFVGSVIENAFSGSLILGTLVISIVSSYTLMTNARILGVVYRERQEALGWL